MAPGLGANMLPKPLPATVAFATASAQPYYAGAGDMKSE